MKIVADLHIHSHFSRATSKKLNFEHLYKWAQLKGVHVVGSGDLSHPGWLKEMREKLVPAEEGLFRLGDEYASEMDSEIAPACRGTVRFLLTGEISSIYKRGGKVRKVHNVLFAPTLEAVAKIQVELEKIGNIRSDGRPILGLDSRDLLEIVLNVDPRCYLIPAHIWTPWFSMLGSKSGFDSVEECFDDLTPHIFALETGLSSDPPMNWLVSNLDRYTLVSSSDAHSPQKLAREATLFDTDLAYDALFAAMKSGNQDTFKGTIEFFPEEGKYHHDGHRKCGVSWEPRTTIANNGLCSQCGKPVTVGVTHRVETLADRTAGSANAVRPDGGHPFHSLIPLPEILSEIHGVGVNSKRVQRDYMQILGKLGPELGILLDLPLAQIAAHAGEQLATGIGRMRAGNVRAEAGYDGEFGVIRLFADQDDDPLTHQIGLFGDMDGVEAQSIVGASDLDVASSVEVQTGTQTNTQTEALSERPGADTALIVGLNQQQQEAVRCVDRPLLIVAGPGTGKTRTLIHRVAYLIEDKHVAPENILAITFTNKAASELSERLAALLDPESALRVTVQTFHAFGANLLRQHGSAIGVDPEFVICSDEDRRTVLRRCYPDMAAKTLRQYLDQISLAKNQLWTPAFSAEGPSSAVAVPESAADAAFVAVFERYEAALRAGQAVDFDDLILLSIALLEASPDLLASVQRRFQWISIDEYQDVNLAQYRLLQLLAGDGANLCAIGDPDQAIYGFRGADRRYFLTFHKDYPDATRLRLRRNYRSTQTILDAATQVIDRSPDHERLDIWSEFVEQIKLDIHVAPTDKAEAEYVVHQIEQMVGGTSYFSIDSGRVDDRVDRAGAPNRSFADFAVLYRTFAQVQALSEALDRSGIPYQTSGQTPLYAQKETRLILAHLWLLQNPFSSLHLDAILNYDRLLFALDTLEKLMTVAKSEGCFPWQIAEQFIMPESMGYAMRRRTVASTAFMETLNAARADSTIADLIVRVDEYLSRLDKKFTRGDHDRRLELLLHRATAYGDRLDDFLASTALQQETDGYDPRADRVALMTLHASKGLEFPVVFLVGCEEDLLPFRRPYWQTQPAEPKHGVSSGTHRETAGEIDVDEERRLFYVGMTRAQEKLILTRANRRFLFGRQMENDQSRFVNDIEEALLRSTQMAPRRAKPEKPDHVQLNLFG
jgi:DNA helicase-2/ATP-dependent DNA helicase PcrA